MPRNRINLTRPLDPRHPLAKGLVLWLSGLPQWTGGNTWYDLCRRSNGTLVGGPTWVPGPWGGVGLTLGGTGSARQLSVAATLAVPPRLTVAAWFRTRGANGDGTGDYQILHKGNGSNDAGSSVFLGSYAGIGNTNLGWWVNSGTGWTMAVAASGYRDGVWHRAVGTYDGAAVRLYVDGVAAATTPATITPNPTAATWDYGYHPAVSTLRLHGSLADPSIYSRALSAAEVALDYAQTRRGLDADTYARVGD